MYPVQNDANTTGKYDYDGDSDYNETELDEKLDNWKKMIKKFKQPNDLKKFELVMMIGTMAPAIMHSLYFANQSPNLAVGLARISIVIFSLLLVGCLIYLTAWTNEDSISGMVAQRNLKPSYITILLIQGVSYFVVGMFLISLVVITSKTDDKWIIASVVVGGISPIFSSAILVFPLVVFKGLEDTCSIPMGKRRVENKYRIKFYKNLKTEQHRQAHYFVILAGVVLGWLALILTLIGNGMVDYNSYISLGYLIFSSFGIVTFMTFEQCHKDSKPARFLKELSKDTRLKRLSIFFEFVGLYYYLAALCMVLVLNYKLIEIR